MEGRETRRPPLYRQAQRLLLLIEEAVRQFSRYHKYTIGSDLRRDAKRVMRLTHRAVFDGEVQQIIALLHAVDELKLTLQLARDIGACADLKRFAVMAAECAPFAAGMFRVEERVYE